MRLIPALRGLYEDRHPRIVVQKAAQVFVSEYLINTALWCADSGQGGRGIALFVMPTQTQADDFSQARFDKAIGESPYLQSRLFPAPPGRQGPANLRLKNVGLGYLYLRGSDARRRQLTSIDADVVLLDEYDLMREGTLELAQERLASSRLGLLRAASTPAAARGGDQRALPAVGSTVLLPEVLRLRAVAEAGVGRERRPAARPRGLPQAELPEAP